MISHIAHHALDRPKARRTRLPVPAHAPDPARTPATAEESPHSVYLRIWLSCQAARHVDLLQTIAAAPKPQQ
jgi:hypothetical protein